MAQRDKLRKELAKAQKRRAQRPPSTALNRVSNSPGKLMKHMSRDHADLLQSIEFALVKVYRNDDRVDDLAVLEALEAAISDDAPDDELATELFYALRATRRMRTDAADELWKDALRVVRDSVRRHSTLRPGATQYLEFVADYVI